MKIEQAGGGGAEVRVESPWRGAALAAAGGSGLGDVLYADAVAAR
jgi:hypothetical protein